MGERRASYPRFRRGDTAPRIEVTDDDVAILRHIYRHRFIRTTDLYRLLSPRSPDKVSRRLARLYRNHFLDRPLAQIDQFRGAGSQPLVYGLDNAGARYLANEDGLAIPAGDWTRRNRRFTRENLEHTLTVTRFMVELELACRAREGIDPIRFEDLEHRDRKGVRPANCWSVVLPWHGSQAQVTIAPDAMFGLKVRTAEGRSLRSFFLVEIDRGTMTIVPSDDRRRSDAFLYRSSILRKLLAYAVSHRDEVHQEHLGIPVARILMITKKATRVEEMRAAAQRLVVGPMGVPAGLFLFTKDTESDPLETPFLDANGATIRLAAKEGTDSKPVAE